MDAVLVVFWLLALAVVVVILVWLGYVGARMHSAMLQAWEAVRQLQAAAAELDATNGTHKAPSVTAWDADAVEPRAADYPGYHTTEPEPPLGDEDYPERDET